MKSGALCVVVGVLLLAASVMLVFGGFDLLSRPTVQVVDANGQTADEFVQSSFVTMVENRYTEVRERFNPPYLQFIERDSGSLESFFESRIGTWRVDLLATRRMDKPVRSDMPRILAFQDDGQGRPGFVNDVMLINAKWTYVLWSNFSK